MGMCGTQYTESLVFRREVLEKKGSESGFFCRVVLKGFSWHTRCQLLDFIWDKKCKEQNPMKTGIPVF